MNHHYRHGFILMAVCLLFNSCKKDSKYEDPYLAADSLSVDSSTKEMTDGEVNFTRILETDDIKIQINSKGNEDLKNLEVSINAIGQDQMFKKALLYDGIIQDAVTADLNGDGHNEIYIFNQSAGSGSYGQLFAYQYNGKKLDSISIEDLPEELMDKYLGHDSFAVDHKFLYRYFPVYNEMDANCCPTGGIKELKYDLVKKPGGYRLLINPDKG